MHRGVISLYFDPLAFFFFSHNARSFISTWLGVEDAGTFTEGRLSDLGIEQPCSESQSSWISSFLWLIDRDTHTGHFSSFFIS